MYLVASIVTFLISIFAPWWLNPLFDRMSMRRPFPGVCLAIMTTALGFISGAMIAAWVTWKLYGNASVAAAYVCGGVGALVSLLSTLWLQSRSGWFED